MNGREALKYWVAGATVLTVELAFLFVPQGILAYRERRILTDNPACTSDQTLKERKAAIRDRAGMAAFDIDHYKDAEKGRMVESRFFRSVETCSSADIAPVRIHYENIASYPWDKKGESFYAVEVSLLGKAESLAREREKADIQRQVPVR